MVSILAWAAMEHRLDDRKPVSARGKKRTRHDETKKTDFDATGEGERKTRVKVICRLQFN